MLEPAVALVMLIGQKTVKEFATSVHSNAEMEELPMLVALDAIAHLNGPEMIALLAQDPVTTAKTEELLTLKLAIAIV